MAAIYDTKTAEELFAKLLATEPATTDGAEDIFSSKVTVGESTTDAIDMSMILEEPAINGWILPTIGMDSGYIFNNDNALNELDHFHGHEFYI